MTQRFGKSNPGLATDFDVVEIAPNRMQDAAGWPDLLGCDRPGKPWLGGLSRTIFIGDMADNFSRAVSFDYLHEEVIEAVTSDEGRRHQWQWLTKQPRRMAEFSAWLGSRGVAWPDNLWAGTSVTTQVSTSRIDALLDVGDERTIRFVSVEPQFESIDLERWLPQLNWVIQGGNSGSHRHPFAIEWADELLEQCREHQVAYLLKQLGSCVTVGGEKLARHRGPGGDWKAWPARLRVRQMPIYVRRPTRGIRQRSVAISR
jgi:protein gp37